MVHLSSAEVRLQSVPGAENRHRPLSIFRLGRMMTMWWLAIVSAGALAASPVLDQYNDGVTTGGMAIANDIGEIQTFTAGRSGMLVRIDVEIWKGPRTTEALVLSIWSTDLMGLPATQLAFQSFEAQSVSPMTTFLGWNLGSQAMLVSSGTQLAIVANSNARNDLPDFDERYEWGRVGGDTYAGGEAYYLRGSGYAALQEDLKFRTYVAAIPEPSQAALLVLGLCTLAATRPRAGKCSALQGDGRSD